MFLDVVTKGTTDYSCTLRIVDSTDGTPETGVVFNTAGIDLWYRRPGGAHTSITEATQTEGGAHSDGGFVHISDGYYRLDLPDAAVATGVDYVDVGGTVTGMVVIGGRIRLTDVDLSDAVRGGMTALPNANADAAGGLPVSDAGGLDLDTMNSNVSAILTDTAEIGTAGAGLTEAGGTGDHLTALPWNASWDAEVQSEVNDGLVALGLDHLVSASVAGADVADDSIIAKMVSSAATADWDTFVNTTDALQALRDRGDAAWTTGGGGSITDLLNVEYNIPPAIDLANTASWRIGMSLTNALDDLPTTAEITPGTISIDRKAQGGTTWTAIVTDAAMSETAGQIYYDEVFDTATGYASGDMLRFTFKSQYITVSANAYEITDSTGVIKYGAIVADTPDVNVAQINGSSSNVAALNSFASLLNGSGQIQATTVATDTITAAKIQDGALTGAKQGTAWVTNIQSGLATSSALATVDTNVDAILVDTGTTLPATLASILTDTGTTIPAQLTTLIGTPSVDLATDIAAVQTTASAVETDTQDIQSRLPASLNNGAIQADIQRINNVAVVGDGSATPFTV